MNGLGTFEPDKNGATKPPRENAYRTNISPSFCRLNVVCNDPFVNRQEIGRSLLPAAVSWDGPNDQHQRFLLIPRTTQEKDFFPAANPNKFEFGDVDTAMVSHIYLEGLIETFAMLAPSPKHPAVPVMPGPPLTMMPEIVQILETILQRPSSSPDASLTTDMATFQNSLTWKDFWSVHTVHMFAKNMQSVLFPILAKDNWDWHGATSCRAVTEMAANLLHLECPRELALGPRCLADWFDTTTLEGSPRGHPLNVYVKYFAASDEFLGSYLLHDNPTAQARKILHEFLFTCLSRKVGETFKKLAAAGAIPTRSATADVICSLHGIQIVTGECKSRSDSSFAGQDNQCIVMTNTLAWTDLTSTIGLHSGPGKFRVQLITYNPKHLKSVAQVVTHDVFHSPPFDVSQGADRTPGNNPSYPLDPNGPVCPEIWCTARKISLSAVTQTKWNQLDVYFKAYIVGVFHTTQKLFQLLKAMELSDPRKRQALKTRATKIWETYTEIPHREASFPRIPDVLQEQLYVDQKFFDNTPVTGLPVAGYPPPQPPPPPPAGRGKRRPDTQGQGPRKPQNPAGKS